MKAKDLKKALDFLEDDADVVIVVEISKDPSVTRDMIPVGMNILAWHGPGQLRIMVEL